MNKSRVDLFIDDQISGVDLQRQRKVGV